MDKPILYFVVFQCHTEIINRLFFAHKDYPVYEDNDEFVILQAENDTFYFHKETMEQAIEQWHLIMKKSSETNRKGGEVVC